MDFQTFLTHWYVAEQLAGILVTLVLLAIGHWLPWPEIRWPILSRLARYSYGTLSIWIGFSLFAWLIGQAWLAVPLLAISAFGGAGVSLAYGWDFSIRMINKALMTEYDEELSL